MWWVWCGGEGASGEFGEEASGLCGGFGVVERG